MGMPERKFSSGSYRYGFNGKENDNDVKGEGNSYDFGARIFDPRLGRWLSSDPASTDYPGYSPYNFGLNNPIINLDNDGRRVYYCAGLGGRGADKNGYMNDRWSGEGSKYVESVRKAFGASGVYFRELEGVNGNLGNGNLGILHTPKITDAGFVATYGRKPVQSLNTDDRICNAVAQIVQDVTQNKLSPDEKVNLLGTSMGAVTTAQAALYILEHKEELGLSADFKIDNVILAGSAVNTKSKLYKRLENAINNQVVNGEKFRGELRSGTVDANGENGYNYPEDLDGVTGLAGKSKVDMVFRFGRLLGQVFRGLWFDFGKKGGKFGITNWGIDHPHTNAADDPNFGDGLIKQALIKDKIEGEKGAEGAEKYLKEKKGG